MSFLEKAQQAAGAVKNAAKAIKKTIKKVKNFIKFLASTGGFIIGILGGILIIIILVAVLGRVGMHFIENLLNPSYGGISTEADYETLVGSISFAGYDSFISEADWQDFNAYEYAVLMDVAEYLYEGQTHYLAGDSEYYDVIDAKANYSGGASKKVASPKYMPYLPVEAEYDMSRLTYEQWLNNVLAGQPSARFGITNPGEVGLEGTGYTAMGGDLNCYPPTITYEFKNNPHEEDAGSLVPYITVLREQFKYRYYTVGAEGDSTQIGEGSSATNGKRTRYQEGGGFDTNEGNGGVNVTTENIGDINLMEINSVLNIYNTYLPKNSGTAKSTNRLNLDDNGNVLPMETETINYSDSANWPKADDKFEQQLYYTDNYGSTAYKFPLQQLIDRYLPKSSLLTAWYTIKSDAKNEDSEYNFDVDAMMKDIKTIYNYYCLKDEKFDKEKVPSVQYDENNNVIRDENGKAIMKDVEKDYTTTNKETFIKFGQAGLQSNRFSVFELYNAARLSRLGESVPMCDNSSVTNTDVKEVVPVVSDLLSENAEFLQNFTLNVEFKYSYKAATQSKRDIPEEYKDKNFFIYVPSGTSRTKVERIGNELFVYPEGLTGEYARFNGRVYEIVTSTNTGSGMNYQVKYTEKVLNLVNRTGTSNFDVSYLSGDVGDDVANKASVSDYLFYDVVKPAEGEIQRNDLVKAAQKYTQEAQEKQLVNYEYLFPQPGSVVVEGNTVKCKPVDYFEGYHQDIPFYNFTILGDDEASKSKVRDMFSSEIEKAAKNLNASDGFITTVTNEYGDEVASKLPSGATDFSIESVTVLGYSNNGEPKYQKAKDTDVKAVFDVAEETISLTLNVPQKRMSVMLVTSADTWAKHADYNIKMVQNPFVPDNYRYVIPHSYFSFGIKIFHINEDAKYRTELYKNYFSEYGNGEAAIKEADIMNMLLTWEKYAENNDTAYNFMRDLYKLVMCIRENGYVLDTAYSYLYLSDSVWDFDEGITQLAFWTERLVSSDEDALSSKEQEKMKVKKNQIYWQVVDYENLEECQTDNGKSLVYAIFPHGNAYVRSYFMMNALGTSYFYDGGYKEGHGGADWSGRSISKTILDRSDEYGAQVYDYALEQLKLQIALNGGKAKSASDSFLNYGDSVSVEYADAETQLNNELEQYTLWEPIVSVAPGVVTKAEFNCYGGFTVTIRHSSGDSSTTKTSYAHMKRWPSVQAGDIVGAGTVIGYEGTTGNSGGPHLHLGCTVNGEGESPSKYMGPIFAPFYNKEKALEVRQSAGGDKKEILASDYYSLIRTVILDKVLETGVPYEENEVLEAGSHAKALASASFITDSNGDRYLVFDGDIGLLKQDDKYVVKEGTANPVYWLCTLDIQNPQKSQQDPYSDPDPATSSSGSSTVASSSSSQQATRYRVISAEQIDFNDIDFGSVLIKTTMTQYEPAKVIWGNNVPLYPMFTDVEDAVNASALNDTKRYAPGSEASGDETDKLLESVNVSGDVRARSDCFDISSAFAKERLTIPASLLLSMSDVENPFVIAFYDGPISSATSISSSNELPGGMITDLVQFQESLQAKGIITAEDNITPGVYDENMARVVSEKLVPLLKSYGYPAVEGGVLGKMESEDNFTVHNVLYYNMYVTYGTLSTAHEVGHNAVYTAAVAAGLDPTFLAGVASRESGFQPGIESHEIPARNRGNAKYGEKQFEYNGNLKNLRRAQGLLQVMPSLAMGIYKSKGITDTEKMIEMMRTPYTNALTGAEYLKENINRINANENNAYNNVKKAAQASGIKALAEDMGSSPQQLVIYAAAAYMYNKGPNSSAIVDGSFYTDIAGLSYTKGSGVIANADSMPGYAGKVLQYMLNQVKK